jgi:hypothetical protein
MTEMNKEERKMTPPSLQTRRLNIRDVPEETYIALHLKALHEGRHMQDIVNEVLSRELVLGAAPPDYLSVFPRPLTSLIEAYARPAGRTVIEQMILDLSEMYDVCCDDKQEGKNE